MFTQEYLRIANIYLQLIWHRYNFETIIFSEVVLIFLHVLEGWHYNNFNPVTESFNVISDHHANLMSEVLFFFIDLNISGWDIQEELEMILEIQGVVSLREDCRVDIYLGLVFNHNNVRLIVMDCLFFDSYWRMDNCRLVSVIIINHTRFRWMNRVV